MAQGKFTENIVRLRCSVCNHANYVVHKNKKAVTKKLELKKHCSFCNKHTLHKESKK
jgi:large subunit ribosomal protein L33